MYNKASRYSKHAVNSYVSNGPGCAEDPSKRTAIVPPTFVLQDITLHGSS